MAGLLALLLATGATLLCQAQEITLLQPGVSVVGSVVAHGLSYYKVQGQGPSQDLSVAATPLTGDPDLYASTTVTYPNNTVYTWSKAHLGGDTLTVAAEDPQACHEPFNQCYYYISVYGYGDATFTIVASYLNSEPVQLVLGQPQAGHVGTQSYTQYQVTVLGGLMGGDDLQVLVNPTMGDADLYITLDGTRPTSTNFQYRSASWGDSQDRVVLHRNDSLFLSYCDDPMKSCSIRAGVFGFHDAEFTILVSAYSEAVVLQHGVPFETSLPASRTQLFSVGWRSAMDDLVISLTPSAGRPRLYVSCQTANPDASTAAWVLDSAKSNLLRLEGLTSDTHGCSHPGDVYMSAVADTLASFNILVTPDAASSIPMLIPGMQVYGAVKYNKFAYYQVHLGAAYEDVNIILTVRSGEVDLYVSDSYENRPMYDEVRGVYNYALSSANTGDDRLDIRHAHFSDCSSDCYYVVGVFGKGVMKNEYTIVSKKVDSIVILQDGIAVKDFVGPRLYEYFRFTMTDPNADLTVTVTPFTGDPDIYISVPPNNHPTKDNFTWASRGFGTDSMTLQSAALREHCTPDPLLGVPCQYIIGVYGWTNTSFSIMASINTGWLNPMTLFAGQPQEGVVGQGSYTYYRFYLSSDLHNPTIRITLTPADGGDQDLYVSLSEDIEPGKTAFDYKATSWDVLDEVVISPGMTPYCVDCYYYLAVYGYEEGGYTISVSLNTEHTALMMGVPTRGTIPTGSYQYYSVDWQQVVDDLVLTLTSASGPPPYLYAGCNTPFPNATAYSWMLDTFSSQQLRLNATEAAVGHCTIPDKLYISVYSSGLSTFSLLYTVDASSAVPRLVPGIQLFGSVKHNKFEYYQIRLGKAYEDVNVIVNVRAGEVDLFISDSYDLKPMYDSARGVYNFALSSENEGDDNILIKHTQFAPCNSAACYYIVGVFGKGSTKNEYTISSKLSDSTVTLQDGVAVRDVVGPNQFAYFHVTVVDPDADLTVAVTPFEGDPDIYVSVPPNFHPNKDNYTWISRGFGADTLTLQAEAMREYCTPNPMLGKPCEYYVGVYGWTNTSFSIMASLNSGWSTPMTLFTGQPQRSYVSKGSYVYFQFYISAADHHPTIRISLTPADGSDQDLYVSLSRDKEPGKTSFDYKSTSWEGVDDVIIRPTMSPYCEDCTIYVAVFGYQEGGFQISVSLDTEHTKLPLGMPVSGSIPSGAFLYYSVDWRADLDDLLISVTPQSGRPVLFASCSVHYPNSSASTWLLDTQTTELLRIGATDPQLATCSTPPTIYMSLQSPHGISTFMLMASTDASSSVPQLIPGVQVSSDVKFERFAYYQVRTGRAYMDVNIILTVRSGEVDLYVSDSYENRPMYTSATGVYNYKLSSANAGDDSLMIKHSDFPACTSDCYYVIGVLGRQYTRNQFTLVAKMEDSVVTLQDGVPVRDFVAPNAYEYFHVTVVDPSADLSLMVTPFTGDPDIYVDVPPNIYPTKENHTWASRGFGADTLTLQSASMKTKCTPDPVLGRGCDVYVGVFGWTNTSFSIMASLNTGWQGPIALLAGQPQTGWVQRGEYQYYQFYVSEGTKSVRFVLNPVDEGDQDLYLSVSRTKEPGKSQYDLKSTSWAGVDEIDFTPEAAGSLFCHDCTVYMAVFGYEEGGFTISAETDGTATRLQNAIPVTGYVDGNSMVYYLVYNDNPDSEVVVSVTTLSGDPDIYMVKGKGADGATVLPTKTSFTWKSSRVGDDVIEVLPSDPNFCFRCDYIVAVYGWANTSFTITAVVEELFVIPLAQGRPQTGMVEADGMRFYSTQLGNSAEDLRISLTLLSGSAELYVAEAVNMDYLPDPDDPESYQYTTHYKRSSVLTIPGPHINRTSYAILVYGLEETEFTITASSSQKHIILQEGVPIQQSVSAGKTEFFVCDVTDDQDIIITATALQGDPDILASTSHERPTCAPPDESDSIWAYDCSNYTWIAQSFSSDELVIRHELPCEPAGHTRVAEDCKSDALRTGKLYIGVYGYDDTVFTITLKRGGGHTSLLPGKPQHGTTGPAAMCPRRTSQGSCDADDPNTSHLQAAYFRFRVSPDDLDPQAHVSIAINPACNNTILPCSPGCACNPLSVYIKSCPEAQCTVDDEYPSSLHGHHDISHQLDSSHKTIFIAHDPTNPGNGFCDPKKKGEVCFYYVSVVHTDPTREASFTILASTSNDATVLPSKINPPRPDGIITSSLDAIRGQQKNYEMWVEKGASLQISLETCTGDLSLAVCDGSCSSVYPSVYQGQYRYYADGTRACFRVGESPPQCTAAATGGVPTVSLAQTKDDSYFIGVNGTGTYYLKVHTTTHDGASLAPLLAPQPGKDMVGFKEVADDRVTLQWHPAELFTSSSDAEAGGKVSSKGVQPPLTRYRVYALDEEAVKQAQDERQVVLSTPCGLEHYASTSTGTKVGVAPAGSTSFTMEGLQPGTHYRFVVLAICDADCLKDLSKTSSSADFPLQCNGASGVPCQDQMVLYAPSDIKTMSTGSRGRPGGASNGAPMMMTLLLLILVGALVAVAVLYRKNQRLEQQIQYEMTDTSNSAPPTVSRRPPTAFSLRANILSPGSGDNYEPLLAADEDHDSYRRMQGDLV